LTISGIANALTLHYPLPELSSQIPEVLHTKITKLMYHQQRGELTIGIPIASIRSRSAQEKTGWDTLMTIINLAALSLVEVRMSKDEKAKVIELSVIEHSFLICILMHLQAERKGRGN